MTLTLNDIMGGVAAGIPGTLEEGLVRRDAVADRLRPYLDDADREVLDRFLLPPSRLSLPGIPLAEESPAAARFFLVSWPDQGSGGWTHEPGAYAYSNALGSSLPHTWVDPVEWRLGKI